MIVFEIMARVLLIVLSLFELCLLVRAILSWIPPARESRFYEFLMTVSEPIIYPVRRLLMRMEWVRRCPIDLSVLLVLVLMTVVEKFLYYFI